MSELFPCPNPACTNWNPVGRGKCFRCGQALDSHAHGGDENPAGRHPLLVPAIIGAVVLVLVLAWLIGRWNSVRTDKSPPVVQITDPKSAADAVALGGTAPAIVRTAKTSLDIKGTVVDLHPKSVTAAGQTVDVVKGQFIITVPVTAEQKEVSIVATDQKGNQSAPIVLALSQDATVPTILTLAPPDGTVAVSKSITVTGTASEPIASASVGSRTGTVDGADFSVTLDLQPGTNSLSVRVTDAAGNVGEKALSVSYEARALPDGVTAEAGGTFLAKADGAHLALVPQGKFKMGTDKGEADERPVHEVDMSAFLIDVNPITNGQYKTFCDATQHAPPPPPNFDAAYFSKADYPVVNVTYEDAQAYAKWAGRRLPTEAEWEKAARGTDERLYPWGSDPPTADANVANFDGAGRGAPSPVGSYPAGKSPYGLMDMAGNVWEWVNDPYDAAYYKHPKPTDDDGPDAGETFVLRGGAFTSKATDVRSTNRNSKPASEVQRNAGFRTVAELP